MEIKIKNQNWILKLDSPSCKLQAHLHNFNLLMSRISKTFWWCDRKLNSGTWIIWQQHVNLEIAIQVTIDLQIFKKTSSSITAILCSSFFHLATNLNNIIWCSTSLIQFVLSIFRLVNMDLLLKTCLKPWISYLFDDGATAAVGRLRSMSLHRCHYSMSKFFCKFRPKPISSRNPTIGQYQENVIN